MKKLILALSVGMAIVATGVFAAPDGTGEGTVNEVKAKAGKLNITHGPIEGVMGAMTMDF